MNEYEKNSLYIKNLIKLKEIFRRSIYFRTMRNKKRSVIILEEIKSYAKDLFEVYNMDETTWNFVLKKGGYLHFVGRKMLMLGFLVTIKSLL